MSAGQRSWGWHALRDPWPQRLVEHAGIRPGHRVLDLGAGTGALTAALCAAGADVTAVELHPRRAALLRHRFPDVDVLERDLAQLQWPTGRVRVVANPPFSGAGRLVDELLGLRSLVRADLVLERRMALRTIERRATVRGVRLSTTLRLPRSAFEPRPSVDVVVLTIRRVPSSRPRRRGV